VEEKKRSGQVGAKRNGSRAIESGEKLSEDVARAERKVAV
jgi:hypothetical protein